MVCDVHELLALLPEAQLVSLGPPFGLRLAKDVDQPWLAQLGCRPGPEEDEGIDWIGVGFQCGQDCIVDGMRVSCGHVVRVRSSSRGFMVHWRRLKDGLFLRSMATRADDSIGEAQQEQQLGCQ